MLEVGKNHPENKLVPGCLWPNQDTMTGSIYIYCLEGLPGFCLLDCFERKDFMVFSIPPFV